MLAKMFCTYLSVGVLPLNSPEGNTSKEKNRCLSSPSDFLTALVIIENSIAENSKKEIGLHIEIGQYQIH